MLTVRVAPPALQEGHPSRAIPPAYRAHIYEKAIPAPAVILPFGYFEVIFRLKVIS